MTAESDSRSLFDHALNATLMLRWRDKLIRDLKRSGALVLDILPRELSPGLVNRYLAVKARQML